jgi:fused signal recognition particle receptor
VGLFRSAVAALKRGIARTAEAIGGGFRSLLRGRQLDDALIDEIERRLIAADVGVKATREIVGRLREDYRAGRIARGDEALDFLKSSLKSRWGVEDRRLATAAAKPTVILVVGVNGAGKTIGVELVKGAPNADPAAVAFDATEAALARGVDVLLIDTAGRLHTQEHLMRQLTKIRTVVAKRIPGAPHETLLVLDATSGQVALEQARIFKEAANVTGIFLAKLDGTAKGGIVVAIRDAVDVPVKLVGVGETPDDVEPFDPDRFVEGMFAADD